MAPVSTVSPVTGKTVSDSYIHSNDLFFRDTNGRSLLLRGINLASSAKTPVGRASHSLNGFWEGGELGNDSFVGRVLDLEDGSADVHLARLREWGFNCLRYVTTWESIEHEGPGKYDYAYIDYTIGVLRKCAEYGFKIYMDPHQDLFSRFSGGSGAPYWALIACGLNPRNFTVTGSAYIECEWPHPSHPNSESFPPMIWASNYTRLAVATLNTLFWAGKDYAPLCIIDGQNISDYLQSQYIAAYRALATRIREKAPELLDETVIGWDSLNEPNHGMLGIEDITRIPASVMLKVGPMPTMWQGMQLGMGRKITVENWRFGPLGPKRDGTTEIDPEGQLVWLSKEEAGEDESGKSKKWGWTRGNEWQMGTCVWALHGVWDTETDKVVNASYFKESRKEKGKKVEYGAEYWSPHWQKWARMIRECHPEAIHFIHTPVFEIPPQLTGVVDEEIKNRAAFSTHYYDGLTLITKHWNWFNCDALGVLRGKCSIITGIRIGETAIRNCFRTQLGMLKDDCSDTLGRYPTMMGEIGIPYDLDQKAAYRTGDYSAQIKAMDASLNACDGKNCFNYSIWTYDPESSHQYSDNWNGEDLSVWSPDDRVDKSMGSSSAMTSGLVSRSESLLGVTSSSTLISSSGSSSGKATPISGKPLTLPSLVDLNDGARALPAFCRPFPRATVGQPTSIEFDIKSATFTLKVAVRPDDIAAAAASKSDSEKRPAPTEIYLPFVHFAAKPESVIRGGISSSTGQSTDDLESLQAPTKNTAESATDFASSSTTLPGHAEAMGMSPVRFDSSTTLTSSSAASRSLDIAVECSSGTWDVEGQTLRWWYDSSQYSSGYHDDASTDAERSSRPVSPEITYGQGPNGEKEEWIKIRRSSGPIAVWQKEVGEDGVVTTLSNYVGEIYEACRQCLGGRT